MSRLFIILLGAFGSAMAQTNPSSTPSAEEQKVFLADARGHALQHDSSLPDFVCTQTTRRFESFSAQNWQPIDVIVERLTYFDHREVYKLLTLNGQPANIAHDRLTGTSSSGEFGSLKKAIFMPETETEFEWHDLSTLRGKTMQVYAYRVRAYQSKYHIAVPEKSLDFVAAYHGLIFIGNQDHFVYRLTLHADGIPSNFPIQDVEISLDYDYTRIGEADYLLPLQFELSSREGDRLVKNDVDYGNYQKFLAASVIRFGSADSGNDGGVK
jgi:hypothetical protein